MSSSGKNNWASVTQTNIDNGHHNVKLGSKLISKNLVATKDYAGVESLTKHTLDTIHKIKRY